MKPLLYIVTYSYYSYSYLLLSFVYSYRYSTHKRIYIYEHNEPLEENCILGVGIHLHPLILFDSRLFRN